MLAPKSLSRNKIRELLILVGAVLLGCPFLFGFKNPIPQYITLEAVYYDSSGVPFKIERKYYEAKDTSINYIIHNNRGSYLIKRKERYIQDTLKVEENYYYIRYPLSRVEQLAQFDALSISKYSTDSVLVRFIQDYNLMEESKTLGDSLFILGDTTTYFDFGEVIRNARVRMILNQQLEIPLDSLVLAETVTSFYYQDQLFKSFSCNPKKTSYLVSKCIRQNNQSSIWKTIHITSDVSQLHSMDSIFWNMDTTEIGKFVKYAAWPEPYLSTYHLNRDSTIQIESSFQSYNSKVFFGMEPHDFLHQVILNEFVYSDPFFTCRLRSFEREKVNRIEYENGDIKDTPFTYDTNGMIIEQKQYYNQLYLGRIEYRYN